MRKLSIILVVLLILAVVVGGIGCSGKASPSPTPEPTIHPNFTTYTDDAGVFSISYPENWEVPVSMLPDFQRFMNDYIKSVNSDLPIDTVHVLFFAGQRAAIGFSPNISILVQPKPPGLATLDLIVDASIIGIKSTSSLTAVKELSRSKISVGGKEAAILEIEATVLNGGKVHDLQMYFATDNNIWCLTCTTTPGTYSDYEKTFYDIFLSFRLYE